MVAQALAGGVTGQGQRPVLEPQSRSSVQTAQKLDQSRQCPEPGRLGYRTVDLGFVDDVPRSDDRGGGVEQLLPAFGRRHHAPEQPDVAVRREFEGRPDGHLQPVVDTAHAVSSGRPPRRLDADFGEGDRAGERHVASAGVHTQIADADVGQRRRGSRLDLGLYPGRFEGETCQSQRQDRRCAHQDHAWFFHRCRDATPRCGRQR